MEGVPEPSVTERRQFQVLTLFVLAWTLVAAWGETQGTFILDAVPPGKMTILVREDSQGRLWGEPIEERGPISPTKVRINVATQEFLVACPGIGEALAARIIAERARGRFLSWKDLADRVKGLGEAKIAALRQAGVTLDP